MGLAFCVVLGCLVSLGTAPAGAVAARYYVDSAAQCPGAGTQASPWCNFSLANSTMLGPGNQILLKRGDTFTSGLTVRGSGWPTSYIAVGAYGSGPSPVIDGGDRLGFIGVNLVDNSYVQVEDVSIKNAVTGILINDSTNQTGYRFLDLSLSGDEIGIQSPVNTAAGIASDILVQDVEGASNRLGCANHGPCYGGTLVLGGVSNVLVNRLYSHDNCSETDWGLGLGLGPGASNVVVENSVSVHDGDCQSLDGVTANYIENDSNVTFVNDIVTGVPKLGPADFSSIDLEPADGPDTGINVEDNYLAHNAGPGIQFLIWPDPIVSADATGNVLVDNSDDYGYGHVSTFRFKVWGQIWTDVIAPGAVQATGIIAGNIYYAPTGTGGFEQGQSGATFHGFTQLDNLAIGSPHDVWYGAEGFSCGTQGANGWSYQARTRDSTWANLPGCTAVHTLDQEWGSGGSASGFVSNFEELPPARSTSWVARTWTAPASGTFSVRGRVLMTDPICGSGVTAEITKNSSSTPIWGPTTIAAGNGIGVDSDLDEIRLHAGDTLHFAVHKRGAGQCRVSWTPSVALPIAVSTVVPPSTAASARTTKG